MLDVIAAAIGLIDVVLSWRFGVCLFAGVVAGWFSMDAAPPGLPRVVVFTMAVLVGTLIGRSWQNSHERRIRSKTIRA